MLLEVRVVRCFWISVIGCRELVYMRLRGKFSFCKNIYVFNCGVIDGINFRKWLVLDVLVELVGIFVVGIIRVFVISFEKDISG